MRIANQQYRNITDLPPKQDDFLTDVLHGLSSNPKMLSAKYLYDELGSELFEEITTLEEYYQTRTEIDILDQYYSTLSTLMGDNADIVELGSDSSTKTHILLDKHRLNSYIPIDISKSMLTNTVGQLEETYPSLTIHGMVADYTKPFSLPTLGGNKKVVFFPGSTIGNFEPFEAAAVNICADLRNWLK